MSLVAPVQVTARTIIVAADQCARSARVGWFFHVGETLGADFVAFAAAGEAGAEAWGEDFCEDGSEHGEAGREDADVAFYV